MYILRSKITIGSVTLESVNNVEITRSLYSIVDTAKIKIPVTALLKSSNEPPTRIETAKTIKVGDPVVINLGYDTTEREFVGYVKAVNLTTPLEVICENEAYNTRKKSITTSGGQTLKKILSDMGLTVGYAEDIKMKNYVVQSVTQFELLNRLKKDFGLLIFFDNDKKVYATRPAKVQGTTVKYELRGNVINDNKLQYHSKEDVKIKIEAICFKNDGTKVEAEYGVTGGAVEQRYFYNVEDMAELRTLAEIELKRISYDGYDGEIETFLQPFVEPCMIADVLDPQYSERSGKYYVTGVKTTFGVSGARRTVEIGEKI